MSKVILIILVIIGYIIGAFISKIIITIHDNVVVPSLRIDDDDLVVIVFWPVAMPLFLLTSFFRILYQTGENIGDSIWERFKRR